MRILQDESKRSQAPDDAEETVTPAFASDDNKLPEYPAYALKAGCQHAIIPIRLYIGTDGNVAKAVAVPTRPVADDQCHSAFWAATWSAVQTWRFSPAFRQTRQSGAGGDAQAAVPQWVQTPIMIYVDFEFTFRVVAGKGQVLSR